jgi:hypothetical protein
VIDPWSFQIGAQIADRIQREGVEVVDGWFVHEHTLARLSRLVTAARTTCAIVSATPAATGQPTPHAHGASRVQHGERPG